MQKDFKQIAEYSLSGSLMAIFFLKNTIILIFPNMTVFNVFFILKNAALVSIRDLH